MTGRPGQTRPCATKKEKEGKYLCSKVVDGLGPILATVLGFVYMQIPRADQGLT